MAIKIRRDHVKEDMQRDIQLMRRAADLMNLAGSTVLAGVDIVTVIDEFDRTVREEIDFKIERDNLRRFSQRTASGERGVASPESLSRVFRRDGACHGIRRRGVA